MSVEVTYFSFDELRTKVADSLVFTGEKLHLDQRITVPYAVLRAVNTESGELLSDVTPYIAGQSTTPDRCWGLRCLTVYPALLCLRVIACVFRGGNKPRHYMAAVSFAQRHEDCPYSESELIEHISKAWKCNSDLYPYVLQCIPPTQMPDFIEAGWRIAKLNKESVDQADQELIDKLRFLGLLSLPTLC